MTLIPRLVVAGCCSISLALAVGLFANLETSAQEPAGKTLPIPAEDKAYIEKYLGKGFVGKAVEAPVIGDIESILDLAKSRDVVVRYVYGEDKGKTLVASLRPLESRETRKAWSQKVGTKYVKYGELTRGGVLQVYCIEDNKEGVITRYSPAQPILVKGMKPGDIKKSTIQVKVYDLSDPKEVSHTGHLDMTYQYVGACEIQVPAGKFEALLFKWHYEGKVGPASVKDLQYYFYAPGWGSVAMIEQTDVSAFLVYQDHSKIAAVAVAIEKRTR